MDDEPGRVADARAERSSATLTALVALATLAAFGEWLFERWDAAHSTRVEDLFGILNLPVTHSLISVSTLALIGVALIGRKRFGLLAVVVAQPIGMYASAAALWSWESRGPQWARHVGYSHLLDVLSLVGGVLMLGWCWQVRHGFPARLRPGSWAQAIGALIIGLGASVAATWFLLYLHVPGNVPVRWQLVGAALGRSLGDPDLIDRTSLIDVPGWIPQVTSALVSLTLVLAAWLFIRSGRHVNAWTPERELAIRSLLTADEPDSLAYFATRRDKASVLSPGGQAALTYRVLNGVSLASGDPIGKRQHWPEAIARWKAEARRFGWVPAVLSASEEGARAYAAAGLSPISMGDEAVLNPDHFSLDQPSMTPVRHAVKRARRAGAQVTFRRQEEIGGDELEELRSAAEAWRGDEPERGFSMALHRIGDPADFDTLVVCARDRAGSLLALLTFVPWGPAGISLDVMRRSPDAPNGVVELVVAELMSAATRLGIRRVSLNFCMFRSVYADANRLGAGALTRLNYTVLGSLDRIWQLERLYRSNQKYDPDWRPRYLCYEGRVALPLVAFAAGVAEGFLPRNPFGDHEAAHELTEDQVGEVRRLAALSSVAPDHRRGDQERVRMAHAESLRESGRDPWPAHTEVPSHRLEELAQLASGQPVTVSGRIEVIRDHGGVVFVVLREGSVRFQFVLEVATTKEVTEFVRLVDRGDQVLFDGAMGHARSGEPSLVVGSWRLLAKSLHPVPFGTDLDANFRARQRTTELIADPEQIDLLRLRSAVVRSLRATMEAQGFLEMETPILQSVHGGASARPFRTFSNAYGTDLSLRIAPELYLKRLVVAGIGPVFEIGRNFRNEGVDATHNPEFTALEAYRPYADYTDMRHLTERLVRQSAIAVHGAEVLSSPSVDCSPVDLSGPWPVIPVLDAVSDALGVEIGLEMDFDQALGLARVNGVATRASMGVGALIEGLYAKLVEPKTIAPTFYVDFPKETSPLARAHRSKPGLVERWDLVIGGSEIGTAYSELTDPLDQRARLTHQSMQAAGGDLEAMEVDEAFLADLELGMPPTGGLGLGVDRLAMVLTGTSIRSMLAFPFVRPHQSE